MDPHGLARLLERWTARHPAAVRWDAAGQRLVDVASDRAVPLRSAQLRGAHEAPRPDGGTDVILTRDDGAELCLTADGLAWAPDATNAGPTVAFARWVTWRDFGHAMAELQARIDAHPAVPLGRDAIETVLYGIGVLEGAQRAGFEVDREEQHLDRRLREIEIRTQRW